MGFQTFTCVICGESCTRRTSKRYGEGRACNKHEEVQTAINESLSGITGIDIQVVESLPTAGTKGVIYLVAHAHGTKDNYDEYVWVTSKSSYEKIGNTDVDLSGYVLKTDLVELTDKDLATMWAS